MATREALQRGPSERDRKIIGFGESPNPYEPIALKAGMRVLEAAGIPEILQDFVETIRPDHPDAVLIGPEFHVGSFSTGMHVRYDFRQEESVSRTMEPICDYISVSAHPRTDTLTIGAINKEVLEKSQWEGHREVVEDAVVFAYRNNSGTMGLSFRWG